MKIPPPKRVVDAWSALVGIWGASYLALLEKLDVEFPAAEAMQWPLLIIGLYGTGSIFFTSWRLSRRGGIGRN